MRMDTDLLIILGCHVQIFVTETFNLLGIKCSEAVYQIDHICTALCQQLKSCIQFFIIYFGNSHNIYGCFIAFFLRILQHFNSSRNGINISSHTDQIDHAVLFIQNVLLVIGSSHICHDRQLHISLIVPNNIPDVFFLTEFPFSKLLRIKNLTGCLIAKLHIIYACLDIGKIKILYELIRKSKVID